ncbi:hypothetical protein LPC10_01890 [Methylorubrum sp. B1-46]|uniref:hypothetical protein n=1 Tax=Methylorubrum sp. B1-46 TaxID=2897334 RepID=UPI001E47B09B|nr:hypothetical protein [Methylorubrum sp. B1-46]UGB26392.1 hypothetical protein LPC10_01890 [Methylorubrum sp. B1-46]
MSTYDGSPVFDRSLRAAHDTEVLLSTFVGSMKHEARHAEPSAERVAELEHVATLLRAHAATLTTLAVRLSPNVATRNAA